MLKFDDSMMDLHMILQMTLNCLCQQLLASVTARETFLNSFPSPEKFLFCTDTTGSTEWQGRVPRPASVSVP